MIAAASKVRNAASTIWVCLCYASSLLANYAWSQAAVDSDASSELLLARTLLDEGGGILTTRWLYSTELRVINTQLVYELGLALFPGNWHLARTFSIGVFLLLVLLAAWFMLKALDAWSARTKWVLGALVIPFSALYAEFYLTLSYYIPHICMTFVAIGLYALAVDKGRRWATWVGALVAFAAGLNGVRLIVSFYGPLLAAACLGMLVHWIGRKRGVERTLPPGNPLAQAGVLVGAAGAGYLVNDLVLTRFFTFYDTATMNIDFVPDVLALVRFMAQSCAQTWGLQEWASDTWLAILRHPLSALLCLLFVWAIVRCAMLWAQGSIGWGQGILSAIFVVGLLVGGIAFWRTGRMSPRYLSLVCMLAFPVFALVVERTSSARIRTATLAAFTCAVAVQGADAFASAQARAAWPNKFQEVVAWANQNGYTQGIGTFWNANVVTEWSDGNIEMWSYKYGVWDDRSKPEPSFEPWLQVVDHIGNPPQGRVFLIATEEELAEPGLAGLTIPPAFQTHELSVYAFESYEDYLAHVPILQRMKPGVTIEGIE